MVTVVTVVGQWLRNTRALAENKFYQIARGFDGVKVIVHYPVDSTMLPYVLKHWERHSPDGFEFGYGGSGPADLARSILIDYSGDEPPREVYNLFKWHFLAGAKGDYVVITSDQIKEFLNRLP